MIITDDHLVYETEQEYEFAMEEILQLMEKGENNLSEAEVSKLQKMALAAEAFEDLHYPLPKFIGTDS